MGAAACHIMKADVLRTRRAARVRNGLGTSEEPHTGLRPRCPKIRSTRQYHYRQIAVLRCSVAPAASCKCNVVHKPDLGDVGLKSLASYRILQITNSNIQSERTCSLEKLALIKLKSAIKTWMLAVLQAAIVAPLQVSLVWEGKVLPRTSQRVGCRL